MKTDIRKTAFIRHQETRTTTRDQKKRNLFCWGSSVFYLLAENAGKKCRRRQRKERRGPSASQSASTPRRIRDEKNFGYRSAGGGAQDYVSRIFFFSTGMIAGIRMVTTAPPCFGRRRCAFFNCSPWCGRGGRGLRRDLGDAITFGEECRRSRSCRRRRRSSRRRRRANPAKRRRAGPT